LVARIFDLDVPAILTGRRTHRENAVHSLLSESHRPRDGIQFPVSPARNRSRVLDLCLARHVPGPL
jgi:hypothetical protein